MDEKSRKYTLKSQDEKLTQEYKDKRQRNNMAVKKCRKIKKQQQLLEKERIKSLEKQVGSFIN